MPTLASQVWRGQRAWSLPDVEHTPVMIRQYRDRHAELDDDELRAAIVGLRCPRCWTGRGDMLLVLRG